MLIENSDCLFGMAHLRSKDVRQGFECFDTGSKGKLTPHEFKCAYTSLFGVSPPKADMNIVKATPGGHADWQLFNVLIKDQLRPSRSDPRIHAAFEAFCGGAKRELLSSDMFMAVLKQQAPRLDPQRSRKAFLELDYDGDGCLNFFDFAAALRSDVP